jgi:hypothetical protein
MKFALISNILPPSHTAHAAIVNRLLRDRDPETYCLLSGRDYETGEQPAYSGRLPGRYYHLRTFRLTRGYRFGLAGVRARLNSLLDVPLRTVLIARILRREQCDAVVACTGSDELVDFAAGYLASRLTGARFYAYLLDQFSHMINFGLGESFLRHLEPMIMKGAAAVIVPNEFLAVQVRSVSMANQRSTKLIHEAPVGVKCTWYRGWRTSQRWIRGVFVGPVVVEDHMHVEGRRHGGLDRVEELAELDGAVPLMKLSDDLAGLDVQRGASATARCVRSSAWICAFSSMANSTTSLS